jgi:NACalpha-BTF3-like transcription factor
MGLATGIGQARALLRKGGEDWWMKRLAADMQAAKIEKAKQKAKQQEELASILDFKIDYGKYLPAWGREVAGVYADFINDVATMRQQDPNISPLSVQVRAQEAKRRIGELEAQNNMAKTYLQDKNIMRNEAFDKELVSFDSTFETLNQVSNPGFYHVSPRGSFNYRQVPIQKPEFDWGAKVSETMPTVEGGFYMTKMEYPGGKEEQMVAKGLNDPLFRLQTAFELSEANKDYQMKDGQTDVEYMESISDPIDSEIKNQVLSQKTGEVVKFDRIPTGGGGGGGGVKKKNFGLQDGEMIGRSASTGKRMTFKTKEGSLYSPQVITLESDGNYIDYQNFTRIPNSYNGKSISFSFKPDKIIIYNDRGKLTKYVRGNIVKSEAGDVSPIWEALGLQAPDANESWTNTKNILVPYDEVSGLVEYYNDMTPVNEYMQSAPASMGGGGASANESKGGSTASTKGGAYTKAQEQGIKNVMSKNNISRQEAIDALKAAGKL